MTERKGDFSQGKVSRLIVRLGLPIMLAELVHVLYNVVDRMYIGRMPENGTLALTGLGVSFPLITLIGAFANLCSTGGATLATIARGEGQDEKAERVMSTAFTLLLLTGAVLTVLLYLLAPTALRWLGGDNERQRGWKISRDGNLADQRFDLEPFVGKGMGLFVQFGVEGTF